MRSDKTLKRYYNLINRKFFGNELPSNVCVRYISELEQEKFEDTYFAWTSSKDVAPQAFAEDHYRHEYVIVISENKNPGWTAIIASLVHEMMHVATKMRDDHGPAFEAQRQMIADRGIFKKNAVLSGVTIF